MASPPTEPHGHAHDDHAGHTHDDHVGHAHPHHHGHGPHGALGWAVVLNLAFVIAEAFGGWLAQSTSLWADAAHNLSDVAGLLLAWGAARLALSPRTSHRTYGFKKATLASALANALLIVGAVIGVLVEAAHRLHTPADPSGPLTIAFALVGVLVNGGSAALFMRTQRHDVNARGAYLHLLADALVSLVVVVSGVLITVTGVAVIDPITSLLVSLAILYGTWSLLRESLDLVLDAVPRSVDPHAVRAYLASLPEVTHIHDLHVWALGADSIALTAHLELPWPSAPPAFVAEATRTLRERFGIAHVTLQLDPPCAPDLPCRGGCEDGTSATRQAPGPSPPPGTPR